MELANTDDGKTIIYIVVCEEDLSIECTGTFIWKEKLLCNLQGNRFFVTQQDNGVVRWRGQGV